MSSAGGRNCQMGLDGPEEREAWLGWTWAGRDDSDSAVCVRVEAGAGRIGMTGFVDGGWVDGGGDGDENGSAGFQVGHRLGRLFQEGGVGRLWHTHTATQQQSTQALAVGGGERG